MVDLEDIRNSEFYVGKRTEKLQNAYLNEKILEEQHEPVSSIFHKQIVC